MTNKQWALFGLHFSRFACGQVGMYLWAWELSETMAQDHHPEGEKDKGIPERGGNWWGSLAAQWEVLGSNNFMGNGGLESFIIPGFVLSTASRFRMLLCSVCKADGLYITQNMLIWTIFLSNWMCKNLSLALIGFWANGVILLWRNKNTEPINRGNIWTVYITLSSEANPWAAGRG